MDENAQGATTAGPAGENAGFATEADDARLIAACEAFVRRERALEAIESPGYDLVVGSPEHEAVADASQAFRPVSDYVAAIHEISAIPAQSWGGLRAKACAIVQAWGGQPVPDAEMAWSVVQDIIRLAPADCAL